MKINYRQKKEVRFEEIRIGEFFEFECNAYLKIGTDLGWSLWDAVMKYNFKGTKVTPLEATIDFNPVMS